jgi:hypothetical protein
MAFVLSPSTTHFAANFPDVEDPCFSKHDGFLPTQDHFSFCEENNVGLALLHSHHGVSELLYTANFTASRPLTDYEKHAAIPCSFAFDTNGVVHPIEWAEAGSLGIRPFPAALPELLRALQKLERQSEVAFGFTLKPVDADDRVEVDIAGRPGWHEYLSPAEARELGEVDLFGTGAGIGRTLTTLVEVLKTDDEHVKQCRRLCVVHPNGHYCRK